MSERKGDRSRAAFRGCLLGGAVGDALGAPVEFMADAEIRERFGPGGVTDLVAEDWPAGTITDDTQMSLFTAEALIRALHDARRAETTLSIVGPARRAYLRWLSTQGEPAPHAVLDGWLVGVRGLHARRAPGGTCLSALRDGGRGSRHAPANTSKGCGGVMRVAPVGLALPDRAFDAGCEAAAITHGHRTGWLAAGYLAQLVADVSRGAAPTAADVEALGGGWIAEEALAIGLYCALVGRDFAHGVLLAVNHGGDSDSTGAIAGNLPSAGSRSRWAGRWPAAAPCGRSARATRRGGAASPARPTRRPRSSAAGRTRAPARRRSAPRCAARSP